MAWPHVTRQGVYRYRISITFLVYSDLTNLMSPGHYYGHFPPPPLIELTVWAVMSITSRPFAASPHHWQCEVRTGIAGFTDRSVEKNNPWFHFTRCGKNKLERSIQMEIADNCCSCRSPSTLKTGHSFSSSSPSTARHGQ